MTQTPIYAKISSKQEQDRNYEAISRSEIPELAGLNIDLLTRCVLVAKTSRLEAADIFRNAIKNQLS